MEFETEGFMAGILDLDSFQKELNDLGTDGWELVSCFDTNMNQGQSRYRFQINNSQIVILTQ